MKIFHSPAHLERDFRRKSSRWAGWRPPSKSPERVERCVKAESGTAQDRAGAGAGRDFGMEPIARVHDTGMVTFLSEASALWRKHYGEDAPPAIPSSWPSRGMRNRFHGDVESRLGTYAFDTATPIVRGTWGATSPAGLGELCAERRREAIKSGERAAFALARRPPGHHASADVFGGYCYLNNVAIAAQWFADHGMKPAVLDVDYHHGNGTQSIFYGRSDVLFCRRSVAIRTSPIRISWASRTSMARDAAKAPT